MTEWNLPDWELWGVEMEWYEQRTASLKNARSTIYPKRWKKGLRVLEWDAVGQLTELEKDVWYLSIFMFKLLANIDNL